MKKDKYITIIKNKDGSKSYRVKIPFENKFISKSFNSITFISEKLALEKARFFRDEKVLEIKKGTLKIKKIKFNDLSNEFFENYSNSFETKRKEKIYYNKHLKAILGSKFINDIKLTHIENILNEVAKTSTNEPIKVLKSFLTKIYAFAYRKDYINNDFSHLIKRPKAKVLKEKRSVVYNDDEFNTLLDYLINSENFIYIQMAKILILIRITGIRPSEAYGLKVNDFDFKRNIISIKRSIGFDEDRSSIIKETKTINSIREIPIPKDYINFFKNLISDKNEFIFYDLRNQPLNSNFVSYRLRKVSKRLGFEFRLYMLRHRFSTELLMNNADLRTIQELMGHKSSSMTLAYARSDEKTKLKAIEKLNKIDFKNL